MDNWIEEIQKLLFEQLFIIICSCCLPLLFGNGFAIVLAIQKYLLSNHLPENRPAAPLELWWSGLMLSGSVFFQIIIMLLFVLPIFIGAPLVALMEFFYLYNPNSFTWNFGTPLSFFTFFLLIGIANLIIGIGLSKIKINFMPRTSGLFILVNRLDSYSLIVLAIISLYVTAQAVFFIHPDPMSCVIISLPVAILSAGVAFWMLTDLEMV